MMQASILYEQVHDKLNNLTLLRRMELATLISRMSPFPILGVLDGIFYFFSLFIKHSRSRSRIS